MTSTALAAAVTLSNAARAGSKPARSAEVTSARSVGGMNNDGLLKCKVQEIPKFYPQYESFFDVALDFGVFGWGETRTQFNTTEDVLDDISAYMDGILFLLKPKGL